MRGIATDINTPTAGFVRGQGTLCLVLGFIYAIGLTLTGLNFGILIGLFAGLISFIPYVGSLVGLVLAVGVAFIQFWPDWFMIGRGRPGVLRRPVHRGQHPAARCWSARASGCIRSG